MSKKDRKDIKIEEKGFVIMDRGEGERKPYRCLVVRIVSVQTAKRYKSAVSLYVVEQRHIEIYLYSTEEVVVLTAADSFYTKKPTVKS